MERVIRGEQPINLTVAADAAVALATIADEAEDVNPLIAGVEGCVAVDAVVMVPF